MQTIIRQFKPPVLRCTVENSLNAVGDNWRIGDIHWNVYPKYNFAPWSDSEALSYRTAVLENKRIGITQQMVKYVGRYFETYTAEYNKGFRAYSVD